ncbi:MAG: molybdenum ABC transporter ATP-binding protein, partial [Thiotrichaceae bacterium]|nr:molybdenum ABC transporter ATP-binding protein [Thiotrichaceae bacterium]
MMRGNLQLRFDERFELHSGEFELPLSGVTVLFGRSGSGKSSLLRAISGLDKRTYGDLSVNDELWQQGHKRLAPQSRHIGFVFQDAALFPHKTVKQNLAYAINRLPKDFSPADFDKITHRVNIADKLERKVNFLSGGERQRVAIARVLLMCPKLLFMDEPLSALDWQAKHQLLSLIEELVAEFEIPLFYITHAPTEVERLADRIVFMKHGQIETIETLQQALSRPNSPLFDEQGAVSVLFGKPQHRVESGWHPVCLGDDVLWLSKTSPIHAKSVRIRILAKDVSLALSDPKDLSITNHLPATITELTPESEHRTLVRLRLRDGQHLFSEVTQQSVQRLNLRPNLELYALIKSVA